MKNTHIDKKPVKFIDLFAGIGGLRLGFENAFRDAGLKTECVMTSEIKPHAVQALMHNFKHNIFEGDIYKIEKDSIPDFDVLLGGFPCQPFSSGGKRHGFLDTRGTLFFEIESILDAKKPFGFILENVEGLVKHDLLNKNDKIGRTLSTILHKLESELGYHVSWKVIDSLHFGLPQSRKRIFIVGIKNKLITLNGIIPKYNTLNSILEKNIKTIESAFVNKLLSHFNLEELYGKSIKDKRGGENNIHSWDISLKGEVTKKQGKLLNMLLKERRKKRWAFDIGIDWMDGMPLTTDQINSFFDCPKPELQDMLKDLTTKGYLKFEHPKKLVTEQTPRGVKTYREQDRTKEKGYNIVTGKLSFEVNKVLDPNDIAPTLVATDVARLAVPDGKGLRRLTVREGLRLFGYPEWYELPVKEDEAFDLLGNTVAIPVVEHLASKMALAMDGIDKMTTNMRTESTDYSTESLTPVCSL